MPRLWLVRASGIRKPWRLGPPSAAAAEWPCPVFKVGAVYLVAVGAVAGLNGVALDAGLAAYLHAAASQLVSAGLRPGVAGQKQRCHPLTARGHAARPCRPRRGFDFEDLGTSTIRAEIAVMRHEVQYSRLFRS